MNIQSFDAQLLLLINNGLANPVFDMIMPLLSYQGYLLVIPFLFYMIIRGVIQKDTVEKTYLGTAIAALAIACLSVCVADIAEHYIKDASARVRPCRAIEGIRLITDCPKSFSMPSGHAFSSFAFAMPLFYLTREYVANARRFYPVVLAGMIAFSRLYLGVHYPTDVLAGALMGALIGLALSVSYTTIVTKAFTKKQLS